VHHDPSRRCVRIVRPASAAPTGSTGKRDPVPARCFAYPRPRRASAAPGPPSAAFGDHTPAFLAAPPRVRRPAVNPVKMGLTRRRGLDADDLHHGQMRAPGQAYGVADAAVLGPRAGVGGLLDFRPVRPADEMLICPNNADIRPLRHEQVQHCPEFATRSPIIASRRFRPAPPAEGCDAMSDDDGWTTVAGKRRTLRGEVPRNVVSATRDESRSTTSTAVLLRHRNDVDAPTAYGPVVGRISRRRRDRMPAARWALRREKPAPPLPALRPMRQNLSDPRRWTFARFQIKLG